VTKKPNPQQRAIEKKRARWREWRAKGYRVRHDPDFESEGQHFDGLSDEEWIPVWKALQSASPNKCLEEARLREMIDLAASSSGWFVEYGGELNFYRADYRRFADESRHFLEKVEIFRHELSEFCPEEPDNAHDPWLEYRIMLDQLAAQLKRKIAEDEHIESTLENRSNAAQSELDAWRARLLLIWKEECDLPIANTKKLRAFLIAALQPYMPNAATPTIAKYFIKKWLNGKVPNLPPIL
jgi:hypothetical protein